MFDMGRRDFITLLGAATATWPFVARAQQQMPVIGMLGGGAPESFTSALAGFSQGLQEGGIVEGRNAAIEARWALGEYGRLPGLAADLVAQGPAVIVTQTLPAALAAKAATTKIPIVFVIGEDPIEVGISSRRSTGPAATSPG
jgi:putative ABC transport system substrate-binding protein